jgi:hypothetical protein
VPPITRDEEVGGGSFSTFKEPVVGFVPRDVTRDVGNNRGCTFESGAEALQA